MKKEQKEEYNGTVTIRPNGIDTISISGIVEGRQFYTEKPAPESFESWPINEPMFYYHATDKIFRFRDGVGNWYTVKLPVELIGEGSVFEVVDRISLEKRLAELKGEILADLRKEEKGADNLEIETGPVFSDIRWFKAESIPTRVGWLRRLRRWFC